MIKTLRKKEYRGEGLPQLDKEHLPINILLTSYLTVKKTECFPLSFVYLIRNKARISALTTLMQHSTKGFSQFNQVKVRNKRPTNGKGKNKTGPICR